MKLQKFFAAGTAALMVAAMLAGCGAQGGGSSSGSKDKDALVMATNATFPPYEYVDGQDIVGIDVEVANAIGDKLGRKVEIEDVDFDSIIPGVQQGKYDFGMAGMTVTDERKKNVDFSDPYAKAVQSVIVTDDSKIKSVSDITKDTKIGVQQGTTGDIYASDDYGEDAVQKYKDGPTAVQALISGKVDCVIIDNEPAKNYVKANEGTKILDSAYADEDYAIAIAKDNTELKDEINGALKELKEDGTLDEIVAKYIKD